MVTSRKLLLVLSTAVFLGLAAGALKLQVAFEPEDLISSASRSGEHGATGFDPQQSANEALLLIEGPDVLSDSGLRYQRALERHVREVAYVAEATGLANLAMPHVPPTTEGGLDDLELELEVREGDSALQRSLEELVGGAPEHFPQGTADILERTGGALTYGPIVQNEEPSDAELETLRATVLEAPTLQRAFLSTARDVAIVRVELERGLEIREQTDAMSSLEEAVHQIPAPDGFQVRLAGLPHLKVSVGTELGKDHIQLIVLAIFANLLVLAIGFRSVPSALLPLAAAGISLCSVLGAMGWLGIPLDLLTTIVPPLLITVVVSDAIHFIARYREELREHPPFFAGQITLRRIGAACFVTSLTTAIGFASLALADTIALRRFGLVAAFAVFSGYGITMALLAAALPSRERRQQGPPVAQRLRLILSRIASQSVNRPWLTISLSAALLASALLIGVNVRTDSVMLDQFHSEHPLRQSAEILDQKLGGIRQMEVLVSSPNESILAPASSEEIHQLSTWLRTQPNIRMVRTHLDPLGEIWQRLSDAPAESAWQTQSRLESLMRLMNGNSLSSPGRRWFSPEHQTARIEIGLADANTQNYIALAESIQSQIQSSSLSWSIGGEAWRAASGLRSLSNDLLRSLLAAVFLVFLTLSVLFRDVRLGLLSLPPNLLPLTLVLGWMALRDIPLHASSVMVFAVAFGLVVDGTIHMVVRYREERERTGTVNQGAIAMVEHTGRAVVLANITLLLGFCVLFLSSFTPIREFAELSLVAIVASLIAEVFLLPALLVLFARKTK